MNIGEWCRGNTSAFGAEDRGFESFLPSQKNIGSQPKAGPPWAENPSPGGEKPSSGRPVPIHIPESFTITRKKWILISI